MTIDKFLKKDKGIRYCEIVITEDGDIQYCEYGHKDKCEEIYCEKYQCTREELYNIMPIFAAPIEWLAEADNICIVSYDCVIVPKYYTDIQVDIIRKLIENRKISPEPYFGIAVEKTHCELAEGVMSGELDDSVLFNLMRERLGIKELLLRRIRSNDSLNI